jgi:hypothetical protein
VQHFNASWVSSYAGRGSSWEGRALWMFLLTAGLSLQVCESVCAVLHTIPPLLSFWQHYLISVSLSWLQYLHCGYASHSPWKSLDLHYTWCTIYVCYLYSTIVLCRQKEVLETEPEALKANWYFLFPLRITLSTFTGSTCTAAARTQPVHNCCNWKLTVGRN